jgi:hypothetical protein
MLDEWVAGLVHYTDARANYALLTEIPVRLRAHAEGVRKHVAEAKAALDEVGRSARASLPARTSSPA